MKLRTDSKSSVLINGRSYDYSLRFSKRAKRIIIRITPIPEIELVVPLSCSIIKAQKFLEEKKYWIEKHFLKKSPDTFRLFGKEICVIHSSDLFISQHLFRFSNNTLYITSPQDSDLSTSACYNIWLRHKAEKFLKNRVSELAFKHSFEPSKIKVRSQKTRWGSCSAKGHLSFNFRLMKFRKEVIDYVIIHELCHLKEMNHSVKFWKIVQSFCPDFRALKTELKAG